MNAWDIYTGDVGIGPHPLVIVSSPQRTKLKPVVNVLKCSSQPPTRPANEVEVILDEADGLDWATLCSCDLLFALDKVLLKEHRGTVTSARRAAIIDRS